MTTPHNYEGHDLEVLADLPNYYGWIADLFRPWVKGCTMEIGTGIGTITRHIFDKADELILVEPSAHLTQLLPTAIAESKKVTIHNQMLETHLPGMPDESCDTVVMVNVLEHIEDDGEALQSLFRVLKPGGHLLLFVPALQFLFSELDRKHGHFRRYHLAPLEFKLNGHGFRIREKRYFDFAGVLPWWLINTVGKKTDFNSAMAVTYDRYIVPVTRFMERWISPPFGKNILIIAERTEPAPREKEEF